MDILDRGKWMSHYVSLPGRALSEKKIIMPSVDSAYKSEVLNCGSVWNHAGLQQYWPTARPRAHFPVSVFILLSHLGHLEPPHVSCFALLPRTYSATSHALNGHSCQRLWNPEGQKKERVSSACIVLFETCSIILQITIMKHAQLPVPDRPGQ